MWMSYNTQQGCQVVMSEKATSAVKKARKQQKKHTQDKYTRTLSNTHTSCTALLKDNIYIRRIRLTQLMNV